MHRIRPSLPALLPAHPTTGSLAPALPIPAVRRIPAHMIAPEPARLPSPPILLTTANQAPALPILAAKQITVRTIAAPTARLRRRITADARYTDARTRMPSTTILAPIPTTDRAITMAVTMCM